ncbi:MAG: GxxExxY protein [Kiritimatiellia bacterium]
MTIDEITGAVLDAAIKIHRTFGPGMLESVYERLLASELGRRGFSVETQKSVSFEYEGEMFADAFRLDMLIEGRVVVELKSTEKNAPVYHKQVKTYLKVMGLQVGLLINFGMSTVKEGFVRIVNDFDETNSCLRVNMLRNSASPRENGGDGMVHAEGQSCGVEGTA